ncbi:MAG: Abi family protein, partial [Dolichospermum sp. JUN01]|nr:Abi family protein [Dolichospermum sp. JUN01]
MPEPKLTEDDLKDIILAFSEARMKPYLNATNNSYSDAIRIYEINTKLCEAMYPSLHTLEISLRNQMNTVLSVKYDNDWFTNGNIQLEKYERDTINSALIKCKNNLNNLIPELNFGFWKSLINQRFYQSTIWNPCSKQIFKYAQKSELNIIDIRLKIRKILKLRNRTFHHEPIWNYLNIDIVHRDIHFFINLINPKVGNWLREYDRFPE